MAASPPQKENDNRTSSSLKKTPDSSRLELTDTFEFGERLWTLVLTPSEKLVADLRPWVAWVVLGLGLLLTSTLGAFLLVLTGQTIELSRSNEELGREVSERKRVEKALRFTQYAVDHAAEVMFTVNSKESILAANALACHRLGYTNEERLLVLCWFFGTSVNGNYWRKK